MRSDTASGMGSGVAWPGATACPSSSGPDTRQVLVRDDRVELVSGDDDNVLSLPTCVVFRTEGLASTELTQRPGPRADHYPSRKPRPRIS